MVNIDDFVKRLEIILDYYSLNASGFADKIGVQRSSMSHLLSGRNKPSLDFVLKILEVFPDVDLYWILNGKGSFPKNPEKPSDEIPAKIEKTDSPILVNENPKDENLFSGLGYDKNISEQNVPLSKIKEASFNADESEIEKIVFFYKNGTFKVYNP
ncbi:helix-turn-helix transcriptional regulator [Flavobacterium sp. HTF]|uniref:helix-turn-helix transcriptional regulator n=1 Tax=Flavobacterium sp. HTF TaxID=2170732 RepID=UPI000D5C698D|nr:helix-turn-helix transcriptional regulator [Flavobacterium sp. HTF]PWB20819.1 XRE family transcriptional regulator [Flavobacterium sp. HTF]